MLPRRTIFFASAALTLAGVSVACGLSTIGTGDPFYGSFDGAVDHTSADSAEGDSDGADGASVLPTDGASDADATLDAGTGADAPDGTPICSAACVAAGGTCTGSVCTIDCTNSTVGGCATPTCPPGHSCIIKCGGGDCHGAVSCANAVACDIQCTGGDSCQGGVVCGGALCSVDCAGGGSCHSDITCNAARCNINCSSGDTCTKNVTCSAAIGCSISCSNSAVCKNLELGAPDAAVSCGGNDCQNVSCYADGGQCRLGCAGSSCAGKICCSGKCSGTNNGNGADTCP